MPVHRRVGLPIPHGYRCNLVFSLVLFDFRRQFANRLREGMGWANEEADCEYMHSRNRTMQSRKTVLVLVLVISDRANGSIYVTSTIRIEILLCRQDETAYLKGGIWLLTIQQQQTTLSIPPRKTQTFPALSLPTIALHDKYPP